jgi:hypothetical protein
MPLLAWLLAAPHGQLRSAVPYAIADMVARRAACPCCALRRAVCSLPFLGPRGRGRGMSPCAARSSLVLRRYLSSSCVAGPRGRGRGARDVGRHRGRGGLPVRRRRRRARAALSRTPVKS